MINIIVILCYVFMMFVPIFLMMVTEQYVEEKREEKQNKRIHDTIHDIHLHSREKR